MRIRSNSSSRSETNGYGGTHLAATRAADARSRRRNPVIVIPGVMGSRLIAASETPVWGDFRSGHQSPASVEGSRLFCVPMQLGAPLDRLEATSRPGGTLGVLQTSFVQLPLRLKVYDDILVALGVPSYTRSHIHDDADAASSDRAVAFEFDYDWRRSLDESAVRLHRFILQAKRFLRIQRGLHEAIRFDVVAHSMGGLLLRYYLRYGPRLLPHDGSPPRPDWSGAEHIETAVIVGTPSAGSLSMVHRLFAGVPRNPVLPTYSPLQVGTIPSGYLLLPRTRHRPFVRTDRAGRTDLLDPETWLELGWGLVDPTRADELARLLPDVDSPSARAAVAEDHLRKCLRNARHLHRAMDLEMPPRPDWLRMHLFLGDAKRTPERALADVERRTLRNVSFAPGDGTVLRSSGLLDERMGDERPAPRVRSPLAWDSVTLLSADHRAQLGDPFFLKNLFFLLYDAER